MACKYDGGFAEGDVRGFVLTIRDSSDPRAVNRATELLLNAMASRIERVCDSAWVRHQSPEDLRQECSIALYECCRNYDEPYKPDTPFARYAYTVMRWRLYEKYFWFANRACRYDPGISHYSLDSMPEDEPKEFEKRYEQIEGIDTLIEGERELMPLLSVKERLVYYALIDTYAAEGQTDKTDSLYQRVRKQLGQDYGLSMSVKSINNAITRIKGKAKNRGL